MRAPRVVLLLALVVPLMGNDCSVVARVGGPPPPPPDGGDPPPATGGGGIIIVTSGEGTSASSAAAMRRVEVPLIASVLATSVATVPDESPPLASPVGMLARGSAFASEPLDPSSRAVAPGPGFATPEPSGGLLFLLGFGLVAGALGAKRRRA